MLEGWGGERSEPGKEPIWPAIHTRMSVRPWMGQFTVSSTDPCGSTRIEERSTRKARKGLQSRANDVRGAPRVRVWVLTAGAIGCQVSATHSVLTQSVCRILRSECSICRRVSEGAGAPDHTSGRPIYAHVDILDAGVARGGCTLELTRL